MKGRLPFVALLLCALGFLAGLAWLFQLRFAHGDVYPPYSSLRADPLGSMALFESLEGLPGVTVRRDFSSDGKLPGMKAAYLHLAGDPEDWQEMPVDVVKEIEGFLTQGGRLIVAFEPDWRGVQGPSVKTWTVPPAVVPGNTNTPVTVTMTNSTPRLGKTLKQIQRQQDGRRYVSVESRWGFVLDSQRLTVNPDGTTQEIFVQNKTALPLPARLAWHSANHFEARDTNWNVIYARGTNVVLMEKRFGTGALVLATDCYFASNESLAREPQAALLAWLVTPCSTVIFDEAHLGVVEDPGMTALMWRYGLQGLVAGALLLLALFIWKNSTTFIPFQPAPLAARNEIAGKDSNAGFVNLLRRHVKPADVLSVCFDEWTKSLRQRANYTLSGVDRAQAVMEAEIAKPVRARNPIQTYNQISSALKHASRNPKPETKDEH